MSEMTLRPSLATMPPELLDLMLPTPLRMGVRVDKGPSWGQEWLAIKKKWYYGEEPMEKDWPYRKNPAKSIALLRSLAQVCRSLRAFVLPRLWAIVDVDRVEELGRLRETLRASPYLAGFIRSLSFFWELERKPIDHVLCVYDEYDESEGSLLDVAFRNRTEMWTDIALTHGHEIKDTMESIRHIEHDDKTFLEPGDPPLVFSENPRRGWNWSVPRMRASGPDCKGEDKLIEDADDFNACIVEIVTQLVSLESFNWVTRITPMPLAAFNFLEELETLRALHLDMTIWRTNVHMLPYWQLANRLEQLSFRLCHDSVKDVDAVDHYFEQESESPPFELPAAAPTSREERERLHYSIAARTIIAAARTGRLRSFTIDNDVQGPFKLRSMLPFWVGVQSWRVDDGEFWLGAAISLRYLLPHASLWFNTTPAAGAKHDRLLTRHDVQALQVDWEARHPRVSSYDETIELYWPYLADEELAQQVADAWNAVVQRGEANAVWCRCEDCTALKNAGG